MGEVRSDAQVQKVLRLHVEELIDQEAPRLLLQAHDLVLLCGLVFVQVEPEAPRRRGLRRCSLRWALGACRREEPVSNFLRTRRTKLLRGARRGKVLRSWRTKLPRCRLPRGAWRGRLRQRPQSDCRAFKGTRGAFQGTRGTLECSLSHGLQRIAKVQAVRGSLSLGMAIFVFAMAMVMGVTVVGG